MQTSTRSGPRRVAIAGATGLVGQHLLQGLLADPGVGKVHALTRRELAIRHPKLMVHRVDFQALPELPPLDELYLALGTTIRDAGSQTAFRAVDFGANLAVARAGMAAGARKIALVSAAGADPQSRFFYNRVKGELEAALTQLAPDTLLIARPGPLLGDRAALGQRVRPAERLAAALFGPPGWALPAKLRPIAARDIAETLRICLPSASGHVVLDSGRLRASEYRA